MFNVNRDPYKTSIDGSLYNLKSKELQTTEVELKQSGIMSTIRDEDGKRRLTIKP